MDERVNTDNTFRFKHRFSKLLSDKLELQEINKSVGGYSNHRIFRITYDWVQSKPTQTIKDTLFIIGITAVARTDLVLEDAVIRLPSIPNEGKINNDDRRKVEYLCESNGLRKDFFYKRWREWFKYVYSEDIRLEEIIRNYHLLQTLIKKMGGEVIFLNTVRFNNPNWNIPSEEWLDNRLNWFKPRDKYDGWREFIIAYRDSYTGEHPNTRDHEILSDELYKYIIKNYE